MGDTAVEGTKHVYYRCIDCDAPAAGMVITNPDPERPTLAGKCMKHLAEWVEPHTANTRPPRFRGQLRLNLTGAMGETVRGIGGASEVVFEVDGREVGRGVCMFTGQYPAIPT